MRRAAALLGLLLAFAAAAMARAAEPETRTVTFLHINDVYEIWPKRGIGGLANLATLLKRERARAPGAITTFGGDLISPSLMSSITRGRHMIRFMNRIGLDVAVLGNHEFDFGVPVMLTRVGESRFAWLSANVADPAGKPLPGVRGTWLKTVNGLKVGFVGLITPESATYIRGNAPVKFGGVIAAARQAIASLRRDGAQLVVALTHLNLAEDIVLARKLPAVSLILGGHEHHAINIVSGRTLIFKVGSDAAWLGVVDLAVTLRPGRAPLVTPNWRMVAVRDIPPDPEILKLSNEYEARLKKRLGGPIGVTRTAMTSESALVRSRETAIGNLIADAARAAVHADVAILNGGGIRGGRSYRAGDTLTARHILSELPFNNTVVVLGLKGNDLRAALEHGLGGVNTGRFPQVSGLKLVYDPARPAGARITNLTINGAPLEPARTYRVASVDFLADGGDGYVMFKSAPRLVNAQNGPRITEAVIAYIKARKEVAPRVEGRIAAK